MLSPPHQRRSHHLAKRRRSLCCVAYCGGHERHSTKMWCVDRVKTLSFNEPWYLAVLVVNSRVFNKLTVALYIVTTKQNVQKIKNTARGAPKQSNARLTCRMHCRQPRPPHHWHSTQSRRPHSHCRDMPDTLLSALSPDGVTLIMYMQA